MAKYGFEVGMSLSLIREEQRNNDNKELWVSIPWSVLH
jgi:hypothetical protein